MPSTTSAAPDISGDGKSPLLAVHDGDEISKPSPASIPVETSHTEQSRPPSAEPANHNQDASNTEAVKQSSTQQSLSVTPSSPPAAESVVPPKEKIKQDTDSGRPENGSSLSNTLSSSQAQTPSKAQKPSAISASTETKTIPHRSQKPSRLSRFFRKLVPCLPPSAAAQHIEIDETDSGSSELHEKEKQTTEKQPAKPQETAPMPSISEPVDEPLPAPPAISIPGSSSDADVILPPTPTSHLLPEAETEGMTSGAVVPPGSTGNKRHSNVPTTNGGDESDGTSFTEDDEIEDLNHMDEIDDEEERLILNGGAGIPIGPDGVPKPLLPPIAPQHVGRKCLVLDLDETLVHSSFKSISSADYVVPVEIEYHWHNVYVIKRPGVDNFLKKMGELYEVVVFTASLSKYADPVLDKLDLHSVVAHRLFRESCYTHKGNYVKDLSQLGRPISDTIILDNSPASYIFHPNNAVPVSSWFNDPHDTELTDLVPFLADLGSVEDVRGVLDGAR